MNPGGYNPTGSPSLTELPLQFHGGGGEPRFMQEPSPIGTCCRFDQQTPGTPALAGVTRFVTGVRDDRTVIFDEPLPCVPVASDLCYLERGFKTAN